METTEMFKLLDEAEAKRNEKQARMAADHVVYKAEEAALNQRLPLACAYLEKYHTRFTNQISHDVLRHHWRYAIPIAVQKEILTWTQDPDYLAPYPRLHRILTNEYNVLNDLIDLCEEHLCKLDPNALGRPTIREQREIDAEAAIMQRYYALPAEPRWPIIFSAILLGSYLCSLAGWFGHAMEQFAGGILALAGGILALAVFHWPITLIVLVVFVALADGVSYNSSSGFTHYEWGIIEKHLTRAKFPQKPAE